MSRHHDIEIQDLLRRHEKYDHRRLSRMPSSDRVRLQVNGQDHGYAVSRPGAQVPDEVVDGLSWIVQESLSLLGNLIGKLRDWTLHADADCRDLMLCYFRVTDDTERARALTKLQAVYAAILAGIQDREIQIVDTSPDIPPEAFGYVSSRLGVKGRVHLKFSSLRHNSESLSGFIHEASHKFAGTEDVQVDVPRTILLGPGKSRMSSKKEAAYFQESNWVEKVRAQVNRDEMKWVPQIGNLSAARALVNADSYGRFAGNFYTLPRDED
jgi:hypothetical protein